MHQPVGSLGRNRLLDLATEPFEPEACGWSAWMLPSVGFDEAAAVPGCFFSYAWKAVASAAAWVGHRPESVRIGVMFMITSCSGESLARCADAPRLDWGEGGGDFPLAPCTENSVRALWSSQASHHR